MQFIDSNQDRWQFVASDEGTTSTPTPTPAPHLVIEFAQWQALKATWPLDLPTGVVLPNDVAVTEIAADLPRLALVALCFPKWTDGRAYSQAHLLRARHRFAGEVRATGDVLVDMLPLLHRNGVDAVQLRPDQSLAAAKRALTFFSSHYQGDATHPQPQFAKVV